MWHAWLYLVKLSFWRQGRSLQTLTALVLIFLLSGIVLVVSTFNASIGRPGWNVGNFSREMIVGNDNLPGVYFNLLVPLICLCFGTQALGGEWEERSLVWTLTRPISRPMIYLAKFTAAIPWTLSFTLGGFLLAGFSVGPRQMDFDWNTSIAERLPEMGPAAGSLLLPELLKPETIHPQVMWPGIEVFQQLWPCVALGSIAYLSLFMLFGALFRRSTVLGMAYAFLLEGLIGTMPGLLKRISIAFYTRCMAYDWASYRSWSTASGMLGIDPSRKSFVMPIPGAVAMFVLIGLTIVLLVLGAWRFSQKEYHDLT